MPPRIAMQKFVEGSQNLRQRSFFVEDFAFDKPLSSKFVEKEFVEGSLKHPGLKVTFGTCRSYLDLSTLSEETFG